MLTICNSTQLYSMINLFTYVQLTKECLKCLAPEIMNGPFNLSGLQFTFANVARLQNKINNNSLVQGEVYLK